MGPLGASWGPFGGILGPRARNVRSGPPSGHPLGAVLGASWAVLEASWAVLGPSWAVRGPSWGPLGPSRGDLGGLLGRLGASGSVRGKNAKILQKRMENQRFLPLGALVGKLLEASWGVLQASWAVWKPSRRLGQIFRRFGVLLDCLWGVLEHSWPFLGLF